MKIVDNPIKPAHYKNGEHDLLWHLEDILTEDEFRGAIKMNIIKYIVRENNKNGTEDIDKAIQYAKVLKGFEGGRLADIEIDHRGNSDR